VADLSDWAPITDPENINIKWHVPSDEETACAIEIYKNATELQLKKIELLLTTELPNKDQKKSSADWTDHLREALKYLVAALVASVPLYRRCSSPEEWEGEQKESAKMSPIPVDVDSEVMETEDTPELDEEPWEGEDEEEAEGDDAMPERSGKYADGFINRPLTCEQTELLISIYKRIGLALNDVSIYLFLRKPDDIQAFIELSNVDSYLRFSDIRQFMLG